VPIALPNTTTANTYPGPGAGGAQVQGRDIFYSGWFTIANNAALAQYSYGLQGFQDFSPEMYLAPGVYPLSGTQKNPLNGIRFRSAVSGSPAQVWGAFFYKDDPVLQSSAEFTSTVTPSGGVTPSPLPAMQLIQQIGPIAAVQASFDFTGLPQTFNHLQLVGHFTFTGVGAQELGLRINGDFGNNYEYGGMSVVNAVAPANFYSGGLTNRWRISEGGGAGGEEMSFNCYIPMYSNGGIRKHYNSISGGYDGNGNISQTAGGRYVAAVSAITSLSLFSTAGNNFDVSSMISLYGLL